MSYVGFFFVCMCFFLCLFLCVCAHACASVCVCHCVCVFILSSRQFLQDLKTVMISYQTMLRVEKLADVHVLRERSIRLILPSDESGRVETNVAPFPDTSAVMLSLIPFAPDHSLENILK